jgi:SOS response associated peptidase (SRAP)
MCGRITRTSPRETIAKELGVTRFAEIDWHPRYNVAPSQVVETIISVNGEKRLGPIRWGFVSPTAKEPKPRSRPDRSTGLAIVLSLVVVASASAQAIQEWKTPDGRLFFGDRPPAGSIRVGEVGSGSQPPEPVLSLKTFAAKASQSRNELEQALRRNSDRLWAIRDQLDKVESLKPKDDPEFVMSEQEATDLVAFEARKAETLRRLREAERRSYSAIANLWKSFDELNSKVASRYGGKSPDWWQDKVNCQNCATREEAEDALK